MTDGIELLTQDHREIDALLSRYADSGEDALAHEAFDRLAVHAAMEERALDPEVRRIVDDGDDLVDRAEAEHFAVRELIARAIATPPDDFAGLVAQLQGDVRAHVASEEQVLFPALRDSGTDLGALGEALDRARVDVARERRFV